MAQPDPIQSLKLDGLLMVEVAATMVDQNKVANVRVNVSHALQNDRTLVAFSERQAKYQHA